MQFGVTSLLNLLTDSLIRFDPGSSARVSASLPEVYAALMADEAASFPALRPHQRHAWHAFLVQLGATAMHRADWSGDPPDTSETWASLIRGLTPEYSGDEPWCFVVDDLTKPAFLQPPATSNEFRKDYETTLETPDQLDMLVTTKNHDLKGAAAQVAGADDWLFALISLQTMEGFSGRGNYGISRMNGGFGNRPIFSLAPVGGPGAHVRRDLQSLLRCRSELLAEWPMTDSGLTLVWTAPWDGTKAQALRPKDLGPFYIEVCRRVRLCVSSDGALSARRATSKAARIEAKALNGRTGDPWTPINMKESKSLTLAKGGFTYKRVTEYLTRGDWSKPILLQPTEAEQRSDEPMQLIARTMVRGQGKTEGYYERIVPFRKAAKQALGRSAGIEDIGKLANERIAQAGIVQGTLSRAVQLFLNSGAAEKGSSGDSRRAISWRDRLDAIVDADFFEALQTEFEASDHERPTIRRRWLLGLVSSARQLLREASDTLPCRAVHRYRARTRAESLFEGRLRGKGGLPFLFTEAIDDHID